MGTLGQSLELLRATLEERLTRVLSAATPPPAPASAMPVGIEALGAQLGEGLRALGADLSRAVGAAQGVATASKVDSLSHELEMIHSTLVTLKDLASQQRDHLHAAQELLATRARQGTVEVEVTQELLANERAFMERLQTVLEAAQRKKS